MDQPLRWRAGGVRQPTRRWHGPPVDVLGCHAHGDPGVDRAHAGQQDHDRSSALDAALGSGGENTMWSRFARARPADLALKLLRRPITVGVCSIHSDRGSPDQAQPVVATPACWTDRRCSSRASAGVFQSRVLRGLLFNAAATAWISSALHRDRSVPLGSTGEGARVAALPLRCDRARHDRSVRRADYSGQPILDVLAEPLVGDEFRRLRATHHQLGLPLRDRCSVVEPVAAGRSVASQLSRDRRGVATQSTNDKYLPEDAMSWIEGMPPRSRNHRDPTGPDTPHPIAASSLVSPSRFSAKTPARHRDESAACQAIASPACPSA